MLCARVRGVASSSLQLQTRLGIAAWEVRETWAASVAPAGGDETELLAPCDDCAWRVETEADAWEVSELRAFADAGCEGAALASHAIALAGGCDGVPAMSDGVAAGARWCGVAGAWAGLALAAPGPVHCVQVA